MKGRDFILLTAAIVLGVTISNLIVVKVAQVLLNNQIQSTSLLGLLFGNKTATTS